MYLYAKLWLGFGEKKNTEKIRNIIKNLIFNPDIDLNKSISLNNLGIETEGLEPKEIEFEFIVWRKANAIHKWFVDNIQEGEDNCKKYYVPREKLKELLNIINLILNEKNVNKQKELAKENLPIHSGFFFGSYKYDNFYFDDLDYTKKRLDLLFDNPEKFKNFDFEYTSSW